MVFQLPSQPGAPPEERRDWWRSAACQEADPELFFPVAARGPATGEIARAKAVCATCRVQETCLEQSIVAREKIGVWGGYTARERRRLVRQRRRSA